MTPSCTLVVLKQLEALVFLGTVGTFDLSWNSWKEEKRGSFRKANNGGTAGLRFPVSSIGGTFCHKQISDPFSCSDREERN